MKVLHPTGEPLPLFDLPAGDPGTPAGEPTPATYQTTVYQLDGVTSTIEGLYQALDHRYLRDHDFVVEERQVGDAPALLVHGVVPRERAEWCDVLAALTGRSVDVGYSSGGGTLLVVVDGQVYALTYGTVGRHMVNLDRANPGFGIGFAVRSIAPNEIKQVRRRVFGAIGRIDRNFVPGGQHIRMYGIDKWGEIVGQVCGRTSNRRLTAYRTTGRPTPVEGSDSLRIHLGTHPVNLVADLREIARVCRQQAPYPDLEFITQIRPVKAGDPRLSELESRLDELLAMAEPADLGLAVPGRLVGDIERTGSYRLQMPYSGQRPSRPTELTLADVLQQTGTVPAGSRWTALRKGRITMYTDTEGRDEIGSAAASHWITAQLAYEASQLLLHDGGWYEIGHRHREFLRNEIEQILDRSSSISLPGWRTDEDEERYNKRVAADDDRFVLLDRRYLSIAQHPRGRGIEACDLLGPELELIHVKRAGTSAPLSHLFAQGEVAVDALKYETDAREALVELVRAQRPNHAINLDFRPHKVVYAIALESGKTLTADTLFTFAQVALYRAVKVLRNEAVDVEVIGIPVIKMSA
ncbi:TIGR04141 family sporadically distributed protein [Micromonospora sp. CPCC 205371]|nr:TIGR04141 family sporadically distributed protein [Micromonospora sp. CPCC 205371]